MTDQGKLTVKKSGRSPICHAGGSTDSRGLRSATAYPSRFRRAANPGSGVGDRPQSSAEVPAPGAQAAAEEVGDDRRVADDHDRCADQCQHDEDEPGRFDSAAPIVDPTAQRSPLDDAYPFHGSLPVDIFDLSDRLEFDPTTAVRRKSSNRFDRISGMKTTNKKRHYSELLHFSDVLDY
jgi:hypothetical protein